MVKFIDIDPKEIDTERLGRRGRVSYPIIKAFMERNTKLSKLDLAGLDKNPQYLRSVLGAYINTHGLPIKIFSAAGELHLMRLDLDNDHKPIPWEKDTETTEGALGALEGVKAEPVNAKTVAARAKKEAGKTTK